MLRSGLSGLLLLMAVPASVLAVDMNGELVWAQRVTLSVPLTGRIDKVAVAPGDAVEAGQLLLRFDQRALKARHTQARAAVQDSDAQRAEARREWDRAKELFDRTVLAERELQLAENAYISADAHYQAARAELVAAEVALDYAEIKAPFPARVLDVHVAPGTAAINNSMVTPLVTLAAHERMRARAKVNVEQAGTIEVGASADVRVGNRTFSGQVAVVAFEPAGDARPALYPIEVEFTAPTDAVLRAGQPAVLVLP